MTHRSYSTQPVTVPASDDLRGNTYFGMDYALAEDFYNVLVGKGRFYTPDQLQAQITSHLVAIDSYYYRQNPAKTLLKQVAYDQAAQQFVSYCIREGWVRSSSILEDIKKLNEAFTTGFNDYNDDTADTMPTVEGNEYNTSIPLLWQGTGMSDNDAVNFLQQVCKEDHINDIRLYCPAIRESLLEVRDIACNVKAALTYNNGKAKKDANERTDTVMQRSCKSLQEAKYLARSEYVYDANTRLMRLATNQSQVLVPQRKTRKKFARFLLLDCSTSMRGTKTQKAAAVLLDSIESVVQHGDILHLAFFGSDFLYQGQVTKDNAQEVLLTVCNPRNYRGGTSCGEVVRIAYNQLKNDPDLAKLEIILLSDGEISDFQPLLVDDCVVHYIQLLEKYEKTKTQKEILQTVKHTGGTVTIIQ